jgi:hypothetical protein
MGEAVSKSEINSAVSMQDSSYDNWDEEHKPEKMISQKENENTIINRVWIVKRSVTENKGHIKSLYLNFLPNYEKVFKNFYLLEPRHNVFNIKGEIKKNLKHWALILELSNGSYVNTQFGDTGLSLKEFNETNIQGESVLNAILDTWGEDGHPFSFCFLGNANFRYEYLKKKLESIKNEETKTFNEGSKNFYNFALKNCQDFVCEIEYFLFRFNDQLHLFDYYLNEFFEKFFPNVNMNILKKKYEEDLEKTNIKYFNKNMDKIKKSREKIENELKEKFDKMVFENKLNKIKNKVIKIYSLIKFNS